VGAETGGRRRRGASVRAEIERKATKERDIQRVRDILKFNPIFASFT
jgi:hypothetical protein